MLGCWVARRENPDKAPLLMLAQEEIRPARPFTLIRAVALVRERDLTSGLLLLPEGTARNELGEMVALPPTVDDGLEGADVGQRAVAA